MRTDKLENIRNYWDGYYKCRKAPSAPSTFAQFCKSNFIDNNHVILELGCGNARDSFYFAETNSVIGIDASAEVIEQNNSNKDSLGLNNVEFFSGFFGNDLDVGKFSNVDVIYSRFVLHAMTEELEDCVLDNSFGLLPMGGLFMAEFRTIHDPLKEQGTAISENEKITDHYRRFINLEAMKCKLMERGFNILFEIESSGLAAYKEDDPVVARIIAQK